MTTQTPIVVSENTLPATLLAGLRYLITIGTTFAIGRGWIEADNVEGIATLAVALVTVGYGLYKTHQTKAQLVVAAEAAPNSVAKVV